jgi:hypothetical protein
MTQAVERLTSARDNFLKKETIPEKVLGYSAWKKDWYKQQLHAGLPGSLT